MQTIQINGHSIHFDDSKAHLIMERKWSVHKNKNIYYARCGRLYMHRLLIDAKPGQIVDHLNGDGLDNRIENLRTTNHQGNGANRHHGNKTSIYAGVSIAADRNRTKKFKVQLKVNGKVKRLGYFADETEAARCYDSAVKAIYGSSAVTNF